MSTAYELSPLGALAAESVFVFREAAATFSRPVLLFSGGKDSTVLLDLAIKAFWPAVLPFPVLHIDTGHNFDEVIEFRDRVVARYGVRLVVGRVQDDIDAGRAVAEPAMRAGRNRLQTVTLLRCIGAHRFDAVFGGARRDEEKARAKERVFSFRDEFGRWDPRNQRPELWQLYNAVHRPGEHIRVFPLSNWTEMDIWCYVRDEGIELPSIYYAHRRSVFQRDGMLLAHTRFTIPEAGEEPFDALVRFRTVGDATCTGCIESAASTPAEVVAEVATTRTSERGVTRADDRISETGNGGPQAGGVLLMTGDADPTSLLRLATAGSVDDGKSTLIGRLLYDAKVALSDQLAAVEWTSREQGEAYPNLALLTDGLRAEREQGITIDVAYRYFSTPKRKFIIADTPGHVQYTRNMVTGASTADLALVLVDARKGVVEQSRRHAFIAGLLGVPHMVVCVNKMDLVDWSAGRFAEIRAEFRRFAMKLTVSDLVFIPVCALHGDNIVGRSENMPWYEGTPLLPHLEQVHVASDRNLIDARFPVQYVIRPSGNGADHGRGYAGTVAGGVFRPGDEVVVLPSGLAGTVRSITAPGGRPVAEAFPPQAVTLHLTDDLDVGRGDLICRPNNRPHVGQEIDAMLCWLSERTGLTPSAGYLVRHTTRAVPATLTELVYRLDVNTLHRDETATSLSLNEIGRVRLRTHAPLLFDPYRRNRATGGFILVDRVTNNTVAAGMITGPSQQAPTVVWHAGAVSRVDRAANGLTVWFTGLSASGKSTIARELERRLVVIGRPAYLLDGDNLRHGLNADLGFSAEDRAENVRRVGEVAQLFTDAGLVALVCLISPYRADRDQVRARHDAAGLPFLEVFVDTPLEICEARDPKGLYTRARTGQLTGFTGIDAPYEPPLAPDLIVRPEDGDPATLAAHLLDLIRALERWEDAVPRRGQGQRPCGVPEVGHLR